MDRTGPVFIDNPAPNDGFLNATHRLVDVVMLFREVQKRELVSKGAEVADEAVSNLVELESDPANSALSRKEVVVGIAPIRNWLISQIQRPRI